MSLRWWLRIAITKIAQIYNILDTCILLYIYLQYKHHTFSLTNRWQHQCHSRSFTLILNGSILLSMWVCSTNSYIEQVKDIYIKTCCFVVSIFYDSLLKASVWIEYVQCMTNTEVIRQHPECINHSIIGIVGCENDLPIISL